MGKEKSGGLLQIFPEKKQTEIIMKGGMFVFERPAFKNEHFTPHTAFSSSENQHLNKWHLFSGPVHTPLNRCPCLSAT